MSFFFRAIKYCCSSIAVSAKYPAATDIGGGHSDPGPVDARKTERCHPWCLRAVELKA
jgi:hypothetical protein